MNEGVDIGFHRGIVLGPLHRLLLQVPCLLTLPKVLTGAQTGLPGDFYGVPFCL